MVRVLGLFVVDGGFIVCSACGKQSVTMEPTPEYVAWLLSQHRCGPPDTRWEQEARMVG